MEGQKKGGDEEEEDTKGKEGMLEGEEGGDRLGRGEVLVMGWVGLEGSGWGDVGEKKRDDKKNVQRLETNNREQ